MRQFRFRKQADGTTHLNQVHPPASGLSTGKETEETLLVLTPEEMAATDHVDEPLPAPVSDTSKAEGLSNASPSPAPVSAESTVLDGTVDDVTTAVATMTEGDLMALRETEVAGKNRKGVLAAIDARIETLTAPKE